MTSMRRIFLCLAISAMVLGAGVALATTYTYTSFAYPGATETYAYGINDSGQIVGYYHDGSTYHGFLKDGATYTSLDYPGATFTEAYGINDSGKIVGFYCDDSGYYHGFLKDGATYTSLDYPGATYTYAFGINDSGEIVGSYYDASYGYHHGFLKDGATYTSLDYPGATQNYAFGINDSGQIVGYYTSSGYYHGFLKDGATYTSFDYPGSTTETYAFDINASGQIVGYYETTSSHYHGFLKVGASYTSFDYPGATQTYAYGINDSGQIVGYQSGGSGNGPCFIASPTTYSQYYFTCYYNNGSGDTYTGSVYAATGYNGYQVGYTQTFTDENGQTGYYTISSAATVSDGSKVGQVYVTSYYDKESGNTYTPVSNGSAVGTNYLTSEHDYIILSAIQEFYFGGGYYEADVGSYSRFDFTFSYNNGSGDYYTGYVYAPTSFETSQGGFLSVGTYLYIQPQPLWASGYHSLNGAAYYITAITDGYASSYDKESYITSYYDSDTAGTSLGVNSDGSATAGTVYVADRSTSWESGYALSGSQHDTFSVYKEADVTLSAAAPPSPAAYSPAAASQAVWAAYWSQAPNLLKEEYFKEFKSNP